MWPMVVAELASSLDLAMVVGVCPALGMTGQEVGPCGGTGDDGSWDPVSGFVTAMSLSRSCRAVPVVRR